MVLLQGVIASYVFLSVTRGNSIVRSVAVVFGMF